MDRRTSPASPGSSEIPSACLSWPWLERGEDAVGFDPPIGAAGEFLLASGAEQALLGEVGDPGLTFGGALRRPGRQTDVLHGFGDLAHFLGAATAMLDDALEEIGALLLPVDAGKGLRQRRQHGVLDAIGSRGG